ncbi:50S ribosomal protein L29 [Mesosutterella sp. OilRF-GAM-744-9]|uniref:Large ribosomal subunit protein uL29 n=1 Tax=Mesosutterella porci TaxID=2915351 RepID=A0ABS9MRA0_9BURK|nr:50S ribosomal protein L29 [Mesosutterella sp. oilRF-744-WT-GAM-9]MCG5031124.1 50S ribosomal protein L29 [Mesosutterella sp. oilRF-744-WT-GAM-9]MCI6530377.1 50S ribosomal protein L29 [Mesosutterella sp.]
MDVKELKGLDEAALKKELNDLHQALFKLRLQKATQQLHNTNQIRNTRHDIARIKTILAQKAAK